MQVLATTWLDPRYLSAYLTEGKCYITTTKIKEEMMMMVVFEIQQGQQACESADEDHQRQTANVNESHNDQPAPKKKKKKSLAKLLGQMKKPIATSLTTMQQLRLLGSTERYRLASLHQELSRMQVLSNAGVCLLTDFLHWQVACKYLWHKFNNRTPFSR